MSITPSGRLAIPDLRSGMAFLSRLPVNNPAVAAPSLAEFIESLIESPPPFQVFVQLLEQSRTSLHSLQGELAKGFYGRAIPLGETEETIFLQVIRAWQRMARAYSRAAQLDRGDDAERDQRLATILQRCLRYSGLAILEHFRVHRDLPSGFWIDFYGYYDTAQEWGVADKPVFEPLEKQKQQSHCNAELVAVLLTELAGPYSYTVRDLDLVASWARKWAPLVKVTGWSVVDSGAQYAIDLHKDVGIRLVREAPNIESMRRLDTARLAVEVEQARLQIEQKMTPPQLGLGDCLSSEARKLLSGLARPWAQVASPRRFRRKPSSGEALIATGFENLYYLLSGKDFSQPQSASVYSRKEYEMLYAFRNRVDPAAGFFVNSPHRDVPADTWAVLNESANGFRCERREAGQRVAHKQLIALRPPESDRFVLAQAHWLMQERDGSLVAGVEVIPGLPEPIAVRRVLGSGQATENFTVGFRMPDVPAMGEEGSLILPSGWYQTGRLVDIFTTTTWRVRLTALVQRGADFDRVNFAMAG